MEYVFYGIWYFGYGSKSGAHTRDREGQTRRQVVLHTFLLLWAVEIHQPLLYYSELRLFPRRVRSQFHNPTLQLEL